MNFDTFPKQELLLQHCLNDSSKFILYGGGIKGAKTFGAILGLLLLLKKYPGSRAAIVRDSLPTLKRNTLPVFNKIVPVDKIVSYNQQDQLVRFKNESEILFFSENFDSDKELNRWRGLDVNYFLPDELNELNQLSFYKMIERVGSWIIPPTVLNPNPVQPMPKIIATCNPSYGFVKELFYDRYMEGTLPEGWVYIPALLHENPHNSPAFVENLKNLPTKQYKTFVEGDWDSLVLEDLFLEEYVEALHISALTGKQMYNRDLDVCLCFDFNISNTCLVIQHEEGYLNVLQEYHLKGGIRKLLLKIKQDYPHSEITVYGDASGSSGSGITENNENYYDLIKESYQLAWRDIKVPASNPPHKNSFLLCNMVFKNERVKISFECKGLKRDCERVQVVSRGNKLEIVKKDNSLTHHLDPLRYFINVEKRYLFKKLGLQEYENETL